MQTSVPYIHTSFRPGTLIESGDFDRLGVVFDREDGHHALFSAKVTPLSTEDVEVRKWGWTAHQLLLEVMDRQRRFIASLHRLDPSEPRPNPHLRTVSLRYLCKPGSDKVDLALVGKAFAHEADQAHHLAQAWWLEISALFSYDYTLSPASTPESFREFSGSALVEAVGLPTQTAEIRRYEMFIPRPTGQGVVEGDYVVFPFVWHPHAMEQVWRAMALLPFESLVSVTLRPTCLYEAEEIHLSELRTAAEIQAKSVQVSQRLQAERAEYLYTQYLDQLMHPFAMRVQIVAETEGLLPLARALGTALTYHPISGSEPDPRLPFANYDLATPLPTELVTARENLLLLEFGDWGDHQAAPPYRRIRELVGIEGAHCGFRLPFVPKGGLPGARFASQSGPTR